MPCREIPLVRWLATCRWSCPRQLLRDLNMRRRERRSRSASNHLSRRCRTQSRSPGMHSCDAPHSCSHRACLCLFFFFVAVVVLLCVVFVGCCFFFFFFWCVL